MQLHGEKHKLRAPPHRQGLPSATLIKPIIICAVDGYFINPMRKILLYTFYLQIKGILLCVQIEKYIMIRNHFGGPLFNLLPIDCMPVTIIIILRKDRIRTRFVHFRILYGKLHLVALVVRSLGA